MRIIGVTMVRNEEDVIEQTIRHLLAEGVDGVIVADNLSTDRTRQILDGLAAALPVTVVDDPDPAYRQSEKMTRLARQAAEDGADWVIPFDADELWIAEGSTLRKYLESLDADVAEADLYDHFAPILRFRGDPFKAMRRRSAAPGIMPKVAFRYAPDIMVAMGNHDVVAERQLRRVRDGRLQVRHYGARTFPQMLRKYRQGRAAIELTDHDAGTCWHWRLHGRRPAVRVFLTWARLTLRRKGRVTDPVVPSG